MKKFFEEKVFRLKTAKERMDEQKSYDYDVEILASQIQFQMDRDPYNVAWVIGDFSLNGKRIDLKCIPVKLRNDLIRMFEEAGYDISYRNVGFFDISLPTEKEYK